MCRWNTIQLVKGEECLTREEFEILGEGDSIYGNWSSPKRLAVFSGKDQEAARKELSKYNCHYTFRSMDGLVYVEEYALEYCNLDEDGEFVDGSDYDLAEPRYHGYLFEEYDCVKTAQELHSSGWRSEHKDIIRDTFKIDEDQLAKICKIFEIIERKPKYASREEAYEALPKDFCVEFEEDELDKICSKILDLYRQVTREQVYEVLKENVCIGFEEDHKIVYYIGANEDGSLGYAVDTDKSFTAIRYPEDYGLTDEEYEAMEDPDYFYNREELGDPVFSGIVDELTEKINSYLTLV